MPLLNNLPCEMLFLQIKILSDFIYLNRNLFLNTICHQNIYGHGTPQFLFLSFFFNIYELLGILGKDKRVVLYFLLHGFDWKFFSLWLSSTKAREPSLLFYLTYRCRKERWIHAFPKYINEKGNATV